MQEPLALMRNIAISGFLALAFLLPATSAHAAGDGYCSWYATKAVDAYNKAKNNGCGYSGPAWHGWWDGHKGWCKATPKPIVQAGHNDRQAKLSRCVNNAGGGGGGAQCTNKNVSNQAPSNTKTKAKNLAKSIARTTIANHCPGNGSKLKATSCANIVGRGWICSTKYKCCN